jgi:hypothetical protein
MRLSWVFCKSHRAFQSGNSDVTLHDGVNKNMLFSHFKVHISGDSNPDPPDNGKLCYPSQETLRRPLSLPSRSSLAGKTVFVPGAGRGVGEHITGSAGASCIGILGRDKTRIESAKDRFAGECPGTAFVAYTADIG